jgi:glutathione peroxidase
MPKLYDVEVRTITGETTTLARFAGQTMLVVNTASGCGLTPQFEGLEALYRRFKDRGFVVLGFPCNQFAGQEPLDEQGIRDFCTTKYDVTFPMFARVDVNGRGEHPLYAQLKGAAPGFLGIKAIKWNFTKFLVDARGEVVARFAPTDTPESIAQAVEAHLPAAAAAAPPSS